MTRCLALFTLIIFLSPAVRAEAFTEEQKQQIQTMFDEYLLENGGKVIKSVEKFQEKQDEEIRKASSVQAKSFLENIKKQADLPMTGNKDGDITIVEFFDYNCGYCRRALEEILVVLEKDKNTKVIFLDMPILGPASLEASKWSLAAQKQEQYFEYHRALLEHNGPKNEELFIKFAKDLGLDTEKLKKDKDSQEINETLQNNVKQAQDMNIRGTPGFIIAGEVYPGYMQADKILEIIKEKRENK